MRIAGADYPHFRIVLPYTPALQDRPTVNMDAGTSPFLGEFLESFPFLALHVNASCTQSLHMSRTQTTRWLYEPLLAGSGVLIDKTLHIHNPGTRYQRRRADSSVQSMSRFKVWPRHNQADNDTRSLPRSKRSGQPLAGRPPPDCRRHIPRCTHSAHILRPVLANSAA